jgi:phenylacetate-CoA ligase
MAILDILQALYLNKKAESFDSQQVQRLQERRFRKLLRHTMQKSKFYRSYYQQHGINEQDIDKVTPEDLPVIDKQMMMANYDDLVCDPSLKKDALERFVSEFPDPGSKYRDIYTVMHTSGSSGTIGIFVYGPLDWRLGQILSLRIGMKVKPFRKRKLAFIGATGGHYATLTSIQRAPRLLFKVMVLSISSPLEQICRGIERFQPDVLFGYASGIDLLAQAQNAGQIRIAPANIWCTGDPLTASIRMNIQRAFDVDPVNMYGSTETLTFSVECSHRRLHYFNDWFSIQVVDDGLRPVIPGQVGRLIVTNLYNYTQPLIRYQMNDEIMLSDKPCPCGWPFPVIEKIAGRSEEVLWFIRADGSREFIHPLMLDEFFIPGLEKFQFVQTMTDKLVMKAVIQGEKEHVVSAIRERVQVILTEKKLDQTVRFDVELVDDIQNDPRTGKRRLIVPLVR